MDYLSIEAAKQREGDLILVLTAGVPGPWAEILLEHRDAIHRDFLQLPLDF